MAVRNSCENLILVAVKLKTKNLLHTSTSLMILKNQLN